MLHTGFASHFRAAGASYSEESYNPLFGLLPSRLMKWLPHVARYWFNKKHELRDYTAAGKGNGVYSVEDRVTFSLIGDWGTGTDEAQQVADCARKFAPDFTIHLGDVYYVGDENEIRENYLGEKTSPYNPVKWPMGRKGSFALSGNHEMYARGKGYYGAILPRMGFKEANAEWANGQWASFFCLENRFWRLIGIDTGYNSTRFDFGKMPVFKKSKWIRKSKHLKPRCQLPAAVIDWMKTTIRADADKRGLILLSHHGSHSAFSDWYQFPSIQLSEVIHRPAIWFWGHEHKLAIYDKYAVPGGIETYGRCIGHGGMPVERGLEPDIEECPLLAWDNRRYENGEPIDVGYNGHANLSFDGPSLHIEYRDLNGGLLLTEGWRVDVRSGVLEGPHLKRVLEEPELRSRF
ncbi:MAG: metallophosphoesterase [Candidatus Acidiferrales bacterium]